MSYKLDLYDDEAQMTVAPGELSTGAKTLDFSITYGADDNQQRLIWLEAGSLQALVDFIRSEFPEVK